MPVFNLRFPNGDEYGIHCHGGDLISGDHSVSKWEPDGTLVQTKGAGEAEDLIRWMIEEFLAGQK